MKNLFMILFMIFALLTISIYPQTYQIPLTNADITTALQNGLNLSDSLALHIKYSGSIYSAKDTVVFGNSSLTPFYNRGVVGAEDLALQGRVQIRKGLNILPDDTYGYSNLNFYQGKSGTRGMGLLNFNRWNGTKQKYEPIYQMGVDIGAPLTTDSIPPLFIVLAARDTANVANDLFGIVGHNHVYNSANRYRGTFLVNAMGLGGAVFNIATIGTLHPSSYSLLRLHRSNTDSLNGWMWFTQGASGLNTFIWADSTAGVSNSLTWYDRTTGSFDYLNGKGFRFQFTSRNNALEIQGGSLQFRGGTLTTLPNRTNWASPSLAVTMNHTSGTVFGTNAGVKLFNSSNTVGNVFPIYNYNSSANITSGIHFVNIDQTYKGGISFITRSASGESGARLTINEYGSLTGTALVRGTNTFSTTATSDTVLFTDASVNDIYVVSIKSNSPIADDLLSWEAIATGLVVRRVAGTTSNLAYSYIRMK